MNDSRLCKAMVRATSRKAHGLRRCRNWAVSTDGYCHLHGGRPVPPTPQLDPTPTVDMEWVALWLWGHRDNNPAAEFFDLATGECIREFVSCPGPYWPNKAVMCKTVKPTDTVSIDLGGTAFEIEGARRLIMARLDNQPRLVYCS